MTNENIVLLIFMPAFLAIMLLGAIIYGKQRFKKLVSIADDLGFTFYKQLTAVRLTFLKSKLTI